MAYKKYTKAAAVVTHDSNSLTGHTGTGWDGIYIGVSGDVNMVLEKDTTAVVFKNMVQGTVYPIAPKIIKATSTTATNIVTLESGSQFS